MTDVIAINLEELQEFNANKQAAKKLVDVLNEEQLKLENIIKERSYIKEERSKLIDSISELQKIYVELNDKIDTDRIIAEKEIKDLEDLNARLVDLNLKIKQKEEDYRAAEKQYDVKALQEEFSLATKSNLDQLNKENIAIKQIKEEKKILLEANESIVKGNQLLEETKIALKDQNLKLEQKIDELNGKIQFIEQNIDAKSDEFIKKEKINTEKDAEINRKVQKIEELNKEIDGIELKRQEKEVELDQVIGKIGNIVNKEQYLQRQELYIESQFAKAGLKYQKYA